MKYSQFTSSLFGFILLFGAIFLAQCDTDTRTDRNDQYTQEQVPRTDVDEEDRRHNGTGVEGVDQQYTGDFETDRDQLVADIEELNDNLSEELSDRADITEEQAEQIENDRTELSRTLRELQVATEDDWNEVRADARQTYEEISSRYQQRGNHMMGRN